MTDPRLLSEARLEDLRWLVREHNKEGLTPEHYQFLRDDLSWGAPDLLKHVEAQAERIEHLEAVIAQKEARRTTPTVNPYDLGAIGLERARRRGRGDER